MRKTFILLLVIGLVAAPLFAKDSRKELTVNLSFTPQEGVDSSSANLPPSMLERPFELRVEDARGVADAQTVGQGTNDNDQPFPIRANKDVIAYIKETLQQVASDWGLKVGEGADRVLTLQVTRYSVEESNKAVGSMYGAEVKLGYVLTDRSGKKLAEGVGAGEAHRYGRARSADNCNEVLSDALKEAFANVLNDERLQTAWVSGKASAASANGQVEKKESPEERLRKLDDLLKKGLITKEEYDRKRAEILKDL